MAQTVARAFVGMSVVLGMVGPVVAQGGATEPLVWEAEPFVAEGDGLGLLDAVRATLERDPNLKLREQDRNTQEGRVLEAAGAFDWELSGQVTWEHRLQALRESTIQGERDRRDQIADIGAVACEEEQNLTLKLQELAQAQTQMGIDISTDIGFDAQIRLLEAAILTADNAILRQELENTRANLLQTEISITNEARLAASQACTESQLRLQRLGAVPDEEEFDIGRASLRLEKQSRSGVLFSPFLNAAYDDTQFVGKRDGFIEPARDPRGNPLISPSGIPLTRLVSFGGKDVEDLYTFDLGFEVTMPLAQGRGHLATAGFEDSAKIDLEASELILRHGASESVLNTLFAYWNLVAATEQVAVLESAVERQVTLRETTEALIEGSELPGAELARARAGEANARAQLEGAYSDLGAAQVDLLSSMGFTLAEDGSLPLPATAFPPAPEAAALAVLAEGLGLSALDRRLDLAATRQLTESGRVLAEVAVTALRPVVDLTLGGWFIARGEAAASEAVDAVASNPSWRLGLTFEKPLGNRSARGRLAQNEALLAQRRISEQDLERRIRLAVGRTLGSLVEATDQLEQAEAAAQAYQKVVDVELERLKLGETNLIDSILTEQQQTSALLALISARFQVATLIAQLRFESGTLLSHEGTLSGVDLSFLNTVPDGGNS